MDSVESVRAGRVLPGTVGIGGPERMLRGRSDLVGALLGDEPADTEGAGFGAVLEAAGAGFGAVLELSVEDETGAGLAAVAFATASIGREGSGELGSFGALGTPTFFIRMVDLSARAATGGGALGRAIGVGVGAAGTTERPRRAGGFRGPPAAGTGDLGGAGSVVAVAEGLVAGRGGGSARCGRGGGPFGGELSRSSGGIRISGSVASPASSSWISWVWSSRSLPIRAPP